MSLRVNTNIAALDAYRNLNISDESQSKELERLSSGYRINHAADDAAGLAISEGLRSQVSGLNFAVRNAQDGISLVQTAEGALSETTALLQRIRDLGVQAANGTEGSAARQASADEVNQALKEIDRIAGATRFGGRTLLDGSQKVVSGVGGITFQVGADATAATNQVTVSIDDMTSTGLGIAESGTGLAAASVRWSGLTYGTTGDKTLAFKDAGDTIKLTVAADDTASGKTNWTDSTLQTNLQSQLDGIAKGRWTVAVANNGQVTVTSTAKGSSVAMDVVNVSGALAYDTTYGTAGTGVVAGVGVSSVATLVAYGNTAALTSMDGAISEVTSTRGALGAYQNRLEHTINNLNVTVENLSASESRVRDADMAQEMVSFTRAQILSQAGTAMLAQANSSSQNVLALLRQ